MSTHHGPDRFLEKFTHSYFLLFLTVQISSSLLTSHFFSKNEEIWNERKNMSCPIMHEQNATNSTSGGCPVMHHQEDKVYMACEEEIKAFNNCQINLVAIKK